MYAQMIFDKGAKANQWNKDDIINKQFWKNWAVICKTMPLHLTEYKKKTTLNGLRYKHAETIKSLEKNRETSLRH